MHHGIFRRVQYANRLVMRVHLLLLMAVALLPFPTKPVAEAIRDTSAARAAVIFYGASLLVISVLFSALWASTSEAPINPSGSSRVLRSRLGSLLSRWRSD